METISSKEQQKIHYGLDLLKTRARVSSKFVSSLREGLYELRTEYNI
jgi:hypothetical protein